MRGNIRNKLPCVLVFSDARPRSRTRIPGSRGPRAPIAANDILYTQEQESAREGSPGTQ
jgi:hypothetical protein